MKTDSGTLTIPRRVAFLFTFLLLPSLAGAHPNHSPGSGIGSGLAHPLLGPDHLCAMIAVGLWAAQRGGRALWAVPLAFVSAMTLGAVAGMGGHTIPFIEPGIAASVLILGILIAATVRLPLMASVLLAGVFALFHGFAHGAEIPANVSGFAYAAGMVAATAGLHLAGITAGLAAQKLAGEKWLCGGGWAIAACGLYLSIAW